MIANKVNDFVLWNNAMNTAVLNNDVLSLSCVELNEINPIIYDYAKYFVNRKLCGLKLVGTQLLEIDDDVFRRITSIEVLHLTGNKLCQIPNTIVSLTYLRELNISNNRIENLPFNIGLLKSLEKLQASNNKLINLPKSILSLINLQVIDLQFNFLHLIPQNISKLSNLKSFNVNNNCLERFPKSIGFLSNLQRLSAASNKLTYIPNEIVSCSKLEVIRLSRNKIRHLPERFGEMTCLKELCLDHNNISSLPSSFYCLNLKVLRLDGNIDLEDPPPDVLSKPVSEILQYLGERQVDSQVNRMRKIINDTINCLEQINELNMADPSYFQPEVVLDNNETVKWYAIHMRYFWDVMIPKLKQLWIDEIDSTDVFSPDGNPPMLSFKSSSSRSRFNLFSKSSRSSSMRLPSMSKMSSSRMSIRKRRKNWIVSYDYTESEMITAFQNFLDVDGLLIRREITCFRRCSCKDSYGERLPCIPPKVGYQCSRPSLLIKSKIYTESDKSNRLWEDYKKTAIIESVKQSEKDSIEYLSSSQGKQWLETTSFLKAQDLLNMNGKNNFDRWKIYISDLKKEYLLRKYLKKFRQLEIIRNKSAYQLINEINRLEASLSQFQSSDYEKELQATNQEYAKFLSKIAFANDEDDGDKDFEEVESMFQKNADIREKIDLYDKKVKSLQNRIHDLTNELNDMQESIELNYIQEEFRSLYEKVDETVTTKLLGHNSMSDDEMRDEDSRIINRDDSSLSSSNRRQHKKRTTEVIVDDNLKIDFPDSYNNNESNDGNNNDVKDINQLLTKIASNAIKALEEFYDKQYDETQTFILNSLFHVTNIIDIRTKKLFFKVSGRLDDIQKDVYNELYHQYISYNIQLAKSKTEETFKVIDGVRQYFNASGLKVVFEAWKKWTSDKHRRMRRDLRENYRNKLKSFQVAVTSIDLAQYYVNEWEEHRDVYTDEIFWKNRRTGKFMTIQPTILMYLGENFQFPSPPEDLPEGLSTESSDDETNMIEALSKCRLRDKIINTDAEDDSSISSEDSLDYEIDDDIIDTQSTKQKSNIMSNFDFVNDSVSSVVPQYYRSEVSVISDDNSKIIQAYGRFGSSMSILPQETDVIENKTIQDIYNIKYNLNSSSNKYQVLIPEERKTDLSLVALHQRESFKKEYSRASKIVKRKLKYDILPIRHETYRHQLYRKLEDEKSILSTSNVVKEKVHKEKVSLGSPTSKDMLKLVGANVDMVQDDSSQSLYLRSVIASKAVYVKKQLLEKAIDNKLIKRKATFIGKLLGNNDYYEASSNTSSDEETEDPYLHKIHKERIRAKELEIEEKINTRIEAKLMGNPLYRNF